MVVIVVLFEVLPDCIDAFLTASLRQASLSKKNEIDCLQFDVSQDSSDPKRFYFYERYTDAAAFVSHQKTEYFAEFRAAIGPLIQTRQRYEATQIEPPV
jgi:autoinducer 2-degrading protein